MRNYTKRVIKNIPPLSNGTDFRYFIRVVFSHLPYHVKEMLYEWMLYDDLMGTIAHAYSVGLALKLDKVLTRRLVDKAVYEFLKSWGFRKQRNGKWVLKEGHIAFEDEEEDSFDEQLSEDFINEFY